jgi:hypothetical protein
MAMLSAAMVAATSGPAPRCTCGGIGLRFFKVFEGIVSVNEGLTEFLRVSKVVFQGFLRVLRVLRVQGFSGFSDFFKEF